MDSLIETVQEYTIPYKEEETLRIKTNKAPQDGLHLILACGAGAGMESSFMRFYLSRLPELGVSVTQFNFRYKEAGKKAPHPRPRLEADYRTVIKHVAEHSDQDASLFAGGKSMGGRISSYIAGEYPEIKGLVFLGYPLHPPGRPATERAEHLYSLEKPMLFISGSRDSLANSELLIGVIKKLGDNADLVMIDGADHSLQLPKKMQKTSKEVWDKSCQNIVDWCRDKTVL